MPPPAIEHGEAFDVVIAAGALGHGRAAEFAAPDDQRVVEHAALFQIGDQRGGRLVDFLGLELDVVFEIAVVVPVAVIELDEPHAAFGQAAGQQAVGGVRSRPTPCVPYISRMFFGSSERSINSGTLACIRNAISYCAMRVAISGSSTMLFVHAFSFCTASTTSCC